MAKPQSTQRDANLGATPLGDDREYDITLRPSGFDPAGIEAPAVPVVTSIGVTELADMFVT